MWIQPSACEPRSLPDVKPSEDVTAADACIDGGGGMRVTRAMFGLAAGTAIFSGAANERWPLPLISLPGHRLKNTPGARAR